MSGAIRCRYCLCPDSRVVNTYPREITFRGKTRTVIRRRRVCRHCGLSFFTVEIHEEDSPPLSDTFPGSIDNPFA